MEKNNIVQIHQTKINNNTYLKTLVASQRIKWE